MVEGVLVRVPAFLLGIGLHEWAHAYVADRCGDPTPRNQGRLTLNPLNHLDPIGTLCILFAPIGWGRAVWVQPRYFRGGQRDHVRVALAGPLSNLVLMALGLLGLDLWLRLGTFVQLSETVGRLGYLVLANLIGLNLVLALFNLLPVPPLDGSRVAHYFLKSPRAREVLRQLETNGQFLLLLLILSGVLQPVFSAGFSLLGTVQRGGLVLELGFVVVALGVWAWNAGWILSSDRFHGEPSFVDRAQSAYRRWKNKGKASHLSVIQGGKPDPWRRDEDGRPPPTVN